MIRNALRLAALGLAVFPCRPRSKEPLTKHGFKDATQDAAVISSWWSRWPDANIGVATGLVSGIVVVDVDPRNGGSEALTRVEQQRGALPPTWRAFTGGGGEHRWFRHPGATLECSANRIGPGIDVKGDGGYVIAPPSVHPSGREYAFDVDAHPDDLALADMPAWLESAARGRTLHSVRRVDATSARVSVDARVAAILSGVGWHDQTRDLVAHLVGVGRTDAEILGLAPKLTLAGYTVDQTLRELGTMIDGARWKWGKPNILSDRALILDPRDPVEIGRTILARRFTRGDDWTLRYHRGEFLTWSGAAFLRYEDAALRAAIYGELEGARRRTKGDALVAFAPTQAVVNNVLDALRGLVLLPEGLEPPAWLAGASHPVGELVATDGGLLHVPTRALLPATPLLFNRNALSFAYDPHAAQPARWLEFLCEIFGGDAQSLAALQEIFGYALTTDTRQQKLFLVVGPKRSGKGTLGRVLAELVGANNVAAPTLAGLSTNFGMSALIGKQLAIIADARLGGRADQAVVTERLLSISGEDVQTIDRKHGAHWTGRLPTRFLILTNELPRLSDASGALAARFVVLVLRRSFYGKEDPTLTDKLLGELPGILLWALDGLDRLRARGHFVQPDAGDEAIGVLEDLSSPVAAFVRDCCDLAPLMEQKVAEMFAAWSGWCRSQGRREPGTVPVFGQQLRAAVPGLGDRQPRAGAKRVRVYTGIGLNEVGMTFAEGEVARDGTRS